MKVWRCSFKAPESEVVGRVVAASAEEAANNFHFQNDNIGLVYRHEQNRSVCFIRFACVRVRDEGGSSEEEFVSRVYRHGIWRTGGVKPKAPNTLAKIAELLGYTHDPQTLVEEGWDFEETAQEAATRQGARS